MTLQTKKWFFLILLSCSTVSFGYRLSLLINEDTAHSMFEYAIVSTFFLVSVMSVYEWFRIRKRLEEFN